MNNKICFFAKVQDKNNLNIVQWYVNDIKILRSIDDNLIVATRPWEISWNSDVYYSWWATGSIFPLVLAKLRKKPIIVVAGGSEVVRNKNLKVNFYNHSFFKRLAVRLTLKYSDHLIAVSNDIRKEVLSFIKRDVQTIYHAIDTDLYKPKSLNKNIILTISRLESEQINRKRIKTILNSIPFVLQKYPNEKFVIAGKKGSCFKELLEITNNLKISKNVEFTGMISNEKKLEYFQSAKMYLQPTIHEGFGVAIAESMACGIPVITSANSAVVEVVGKTALFVNPDKPEDLAQKIIYLLENPDVGKIMGEKARKRIVTHFSFYKREETIKKLIENI